MRSCTCYPPRAGAHCRIWSSPPTSGSSSNTLPSGTWWCCPTFTSEPRRGETAVGEQFFSMMGYRTFVPATRFEGEAELKHLHDNVYVSGHGQRCEQQK